MAFTGPWAVRVRAVIVGSALSALPIHHVMAGQLVSTTDCKFTMHVPGLFGGKDLHLTMKKGAVFTQSNAGKFCGPVTEATPLGPSGGDQCFAIDGGKLVSGSWSDKVTASDCVLTDAAALPAFDASALASWSGAGPATLHGQAFLKTVGGDVKTCAGSRVRLLPATPYVGALLAKKEAGISVQADPRLATYVRTTICDAQGDFSFSGLAAQTWYVVTRVTWGVPQVGEPGDEPETSEQGGKLVKRMTLATGDNQVFLTYRDER